MGKEPFPVDRGWAWAIVVGSFVCVFFVVGTAKSIGIFLVEFQNYFDVPTSVAAMVMGSGAIVYAILSPMCILLGQTFTARKVIMIGGTMGAIGMSLGSLLVSMNYVILVFGIWFGFGNSTIYGNVLVMLSTYFRKRRTLANGLALTGASIGQFALPPFFEYLLETYGLSGCILLVGGLYFHVVAAASLFRPPSFYASDTEDAVATEEKMEDDASDMKLNGRLSHGSSFGRPRLSHGSSFGRPRLSHGSSFGRPRLSHGSSFGRPRLSHGSNYPLVTPSNDEFTDTEIMYRSFMASTGSLYIQPISRHGSVMLDESLQWEQDKGGRSDNMCRRLLTSLDFSVMKSYIAVFLLVSCFLCFFGYFNFILFLPAHVLTRGIDKYDKAMLISLCGIGDLCGRLLIAFFGDRNIIMRYKLMAAGSVIVSVNMGALVFANSFGWMAVHCVLYGVSGGFYVSLLAVVVVDFVGLKNMPRLLAVIMLLQGIGASLGQPLLGAVRDATGSFDSVIIICTVCSLLGGLLIFMYPLVLRLEYLLPPQQRLLPDDEPEEVDV